MAGTHLKDSMPINYARKLTGKDRSAHANRQLGVALAFIAGAINAGGYLAVKQYTSHMTGVVSAMADHIALGSKTLLAAGIGALIAFMAGAACSSLMVNYSRRRKMHSQFAFPLLLEALLLIGFGLFGARLSLQGGLSVPLTVLLLSVWVADSATGAAGLFLRFFNALSSSVVSKNH